MCISRDKRGVAQLLLKGIVRAEPFNLVYCFPNAVFTSVCFHSSPDSSWSAPKGGETVVHTWGVKERIITFVYPANSTIFGECAASSAF